MATYTFTRKASVRTGTLTVTYDFDITETEDTLIFTVNFVTAKADSYRAFQKCTPSVSLLNWTGSSATIAANGTKTWTISKSLSVSKTHASQSKAIYFGFSSQDPDDGSMIGGANTYNYTVPAKTSYAITLNANGGSGGTTSLTKWYGESLDLTTGFTAPTRVDYRFEGWALTSGGAKVDEYTTDAATPLYAVWTPIITGVSITVHTLRVANGTSTSESDDGEYCYGTVAYTVAGAAKGTLSLSVAADDSNVVFDSGKTASISKAAGTTLTGTHVFRAHNCDTDTKITFTVAASATNTSVSGESPVTTSQSDILSVAYFPLDILGDNYVSQGQRPGHGLAIGLPAKKEGFTVGMDIFFQQWAGVIQMFGGSTPPAGWLLCDGSAVSREDYAVLYAAIGDTWGAGDGSTTFNLPDLRGRAPIGAGTGTGLSARTLGGTGGSEDAIIPYHRHAMGAHTHAHPGEPYLGNSETVARRTVSSGSGATNQLYSSGSTGRYNNTGAMNGSPYTGYAGSNGNADNANMQPYAVVNYIIHTGKVN